MTSEVKPDRVFYGRTEDMIAEVGARDYGTDNKKFCVMPDGAAQFNTEPYDTLAQAKANAQWTAIAFGVKVVRIGGR